MHWKAGCWLERNDTEPPDGLPPLPESWPDRYQRLAAGEGMDILPYSAAVANVARLWRHMLPGR
ncbi:MAG TPA: hypothetical protein VHV49_15795 [Pseudonocardiaceae bacterium]|jgi:hypothetical protein|nr:hypothetical protein [Pseudonocardiaceae bacterium]